MSGSNEVLREIPQVEKLLQHEAVLPFIDMIGRTAVADEIRKTIDTFRRDVLSGAIRSAADLVPLIAASCSKKKLEKLQRVINATGIIIHTNLGRSPLGRDILADMADTLGGYCNLEYHLPTGSRGKRGGFAESLICGLTGAEDAVIVNNNAACVFFILNAFARGKGVVVSRGELVQIGGGFRIPDIMRESGALLTEVGTTNITDLADYEKGISPDTGMIFSAHRSNYRIDGFARTPSIRELATLKTASVMLVRDLGSGNFLPDSGGGIPLDPTPADELTQGADLVCFSGDKLLGGCQAGIIAGRKDLIAALKSHPLMRMLRVDKISYFILQETLLKYEKGMHRDVPLWQIAEQDVKAINNRISKVLKRIHDPALKKMLKKSKITGAFGGGSLPGFEMESSGLAFHITGMKASDLYARFISSRVPIVGFISDDIYFLNFMTVLDCDIDEVAWAINELPGKQG